MIEQHGAKFGAILLANLSVVCGGEMECRLAEPRYIRVDSMPQEDCQALEMPAIFQVQAQVQAQVQRLGRSSPCAADRLNQNPMPAWIVPRPSQMWKSQFNDLRAAVVGRGPHKLSHRLFARIFRQESLSRSNIVRLGEHVRMHLRASFDQ